VNNKDFMIGVLTVTATVLLTAVVLLTVLAPKPVQAFSQLDEGLGYTMFTVQVSESTEQLHVINHAAGLMNIYNYDINTNRLQPVQQIPLPPVQSAGDIAPVGGAGAR
jgi:hypothetical protein